MERVDARGLRRHPALGRCRAASTLAWPRPTDLADDAQPPEFHWFDLAAQFLRATPVSIYNSSSPEEIQYLADHAGAEIAIVEDTSFLERC